jgi:predicted ABC-type ATPase
VSGKNEKPICYLIAGPNGAGKTTFALRYLPEIVGCTNFVNADLIASGISPLNSISAQYVAGRIFVQEVNKQIEQKSDFAFETTLSGRSYINLVTQLKDSGWKIVMLFLWIPSADFSRDRVLQRVADGGHSVPDSAIYRRYPRIMYNLIYIYKSLIDTVYCYDNSGPVPNLVFEKDVLGDNILEEVVYKQILRCADDYKRNT